MGSKRQNIVVILAGGSGSRFGANIPKQYLKINGKEVLSYSIEAAKRSRYTDIVLVVCDKKYQRRIKDMYDVEVCDGGATRNLSVKKALDLIKEKYNCEKIIVHDSARPLIKSENFDDYFMRLDEYDCVATTQKIVDSLGSYDNIYENRERFFLIQAPEAMRFDLFFENFNGNSVMSALCQFMPKNSKTMLNFDIKHNIKVTYPGDLEYVEKMMQQDGKNGKIKLLAFDLDGTLTQHKTKLEKSNRELLERLKSIYKLVIIGAGSCKRIYDQLDGFEIDIVGNYGLEESTVQDGQFVLRRSEQYTVDKKFFEETITKLRQEFGYENYKGDNVEFHNSGAVTFPLLGTKADKEEKLAFDLNGVKRRKIYQEVSSAFEGYNVFVGGTSSFDITKSSYNKYFALKKYAEERNIALDEIVYVGDDFEDGGNDSQVLKEGIKCVKINNYLGLSAALMKEGLI